MQDGLSGGGGVRGICTLPLATVGGVQGESNFS